MKPRLFSVLAITMMVSGTALSETNNASQNVMADQDPLAFPVDDFQTQTVTVKTSTGNVEVEYHWYRHLPYVARPVDKDYQSLDIKVPVRINGKPVDTTNAPMLLVINVGGYMSVNNASGGMGVGAPPGGLTAQDMNAGPPAPPSGSMPPMQAGGAMPSGAAMPPMPPDGMPPGGPGGDNGGSGKSELALAAGYVVVIPGVRGRDNQAQDGSYYGKAPAAIVDLKSAVRYIRHNDELIAGNSDWIISTGVSAGGALSALLGASGNSHLYDDYFVALGAADENDDIFASADFCPITDLDHADISYEWEFGTVKRRGTVVNQQLSQALADSYPQYLSSLQLHGNDQFGLITADNYQAYMLQNYLIPAANQYLLSLSETERDNYLSKNLWLNWSDQSASFTFAQYLDHIGRSKGVPAFDAIDLSAAENIEFGDANINARHFTAFSARQSSGQPDTSISAELQNTINLMNPMYFLTTGNSTVADHWWIRQGTSDTDTALPVFINLATRLNNLNHDVNALLYWDEGHGVDKDPEDFIAWVGQITGFHY